MTVIAWDGKTLAADKMTNFGGLHGTTVKVHRIGDKLVGGCGTTAQIQEMLKWVEKGCDPEKFPPQQRNLQECVSLLVVNKDGSLHQYESTPWPIILQNKQWAIGNGRDFAIAAMYLGKTAKEAVEVTNVLCNDCGNGVDELIFEEKITRCSDCLYLRTGYFSIPYCSHTGGQMIHTDPSVGIPDWCPL